MQLHHSKYQERSYELTKEQTKFSKRKSENDFRENNIPKIREALDESRTRAHEIREAMPWVSEQEQTDLVSKIEETRDWLDKKMREQEKLTLLDDPAFTTDDLEKEMGKMNKLAKKIFGKKAPKAPKKPKEEKKVEKEEEKSDAGEDSSKTEDKAQDKAEDKADDKAEEKKQEEQVEDL